MNRSYFECVWFLFVPKLQPSKWRMTNQIRETGLSGVELVRALAVDDPGGVRLRGVSRKVRSHARWLGVAIKPSV